MIERIFDDEVGIIYVTGSGAWDRQVVDVHYSRLRHMISELRANGTPIRVLSDVSSAPHQDHALEKHILSQIERTFRPGDRFAILTGSVSDKAYTLAIIGNAEVAVFASRVPAEQWLLLDELPMAS